MKRTIGILIVIAIFIAAALYLKKQKEIVETLPIAQERQYSVATVEAQIKTVEEKRHFLAQLLASKSALVASKFSAEIKKIYVRENDIVKKGELLISLDDREIQANINSLNKQKKSIFLDVENVKRSLMRSEKLLDAGAISQEKYDNLNVLYQIKLANLLATKEKIKQAQAQLTYLNIKAPFSGRVGTIFVDAGNLAVPAKPIISLNSDDQKLIFSYVATSKLIKKGDSVLINGEKIGIISRKYDDAKNALLVAEVKITKALPYANKAFLNIDVVTAKLTACTLPLNAFLHRKDGIFIMLYKNEKFEEMQVDVLLESETEAIVKECPSQRVAVASEAKLALLPSLGKVILSREN